MGGKKAILCAGVFVAILVSAYLFDFEEKFAQIESEEARLQQLKATFLDKKKISLDLPLYRRQLEEIEKKLGPLLRALPARTEGRYVEIMQVARARGLRIDHLQSAETETAKDFYAELPGTLSVSGSFHDIAAFVNDVTELPGMVTMQNLKISATATAGIVTMDSAVTTYRYLDEAELAVQRKAAASKKGKAKK